jgi:peptide/nickel transport system substrate-binding protein
MISRYRPGASLTLVRNPGFRQWSYAAQPAGYPDVIRIEQMADPGKRQSAVAAGRADLMDISFDGQLYRPLAVRYPTRVHSGLKLITTFLFLNTRQPPFTSLKARQALNYAIDRARIIQLLHLDSPGQATPTCQVLPAGYPSYQPYCPYTAGPDDGAWHGPDLATAARLAHESGTTHVPVTVWNNQDAWGKPVGAYLVQVLRQLGYQATVRNVSQDQYHAAIHNARHEIQLGLAGWGPDIPAASDFFLPVLTCRSIYQDPAGTDNLAGFCDHHVDQLASQAQAAQPTDPAAARKLWASIDRIVTDQAAWVPVFNESLTAFFVSARVGNYQESGYYVGPLLDQIWIR